VFYFLNLHNNRDEQSKDKAELIIKEEQPLTGLVQYTHYISTEQV